MRIETRPINDETWEILIDLDGRRYWRYGDQATVKSTLTRFNEIMGERYAALRAAELAARESIKALRDVNPGWSGEPIPHQPLTEREMWTGREP